eukprot:CAMPEP_0181139536 /NCGR_PEP_ID=MMETSP1071-20121207/34833_1 /TAXON_ID=35127 /ORGANISM="Thalassiosira sp., Strain NH16" /LENGTH=661 /DNA_ID=CAMNT_0023226447 /DNA_START=47 /DNA_END=2032 /DNA_ORIENTATION=+
MASLSTNDVEDIGSHAGTLDLTGNMDVNHPPNRARSFNGPEASTVGWIAIATLFAVAIGLSASSFQKSNEALELANANTRAIEMAGEKMIVIEQNGGGLAQQQQQPPAQPQPQPLPSVPNTIVTPSTPLHLTPPPTPPKTTEPHPLRPQWLQTTNADYQQMLTQYEEQGNDLHSYRIAQQTCSRNNLKLCDYDVYCPRGQGGELYGGGPPMVHNYDELRETQWAPFMHGVDANHQAEDPAKTSWVQIGKISEDDGGREENDFVKCWRYEDWYQGNEVNIEDGEWGEEEHRMWMLCCETEPVEPVGPSPTVVESPADPGPHPLDPRWIQTTHADYQYFLDEQAKQDPGTEKMHSYRMAQNACFKQSRTLCDYEVYCPNGQGADPFSGGPYASNSADLDETQWAPYNRPNDKAFNNDPAWSEWVQIGKMAAEDGGKEGNDFAKCWKFDSWYLGAEENLEDEWGDEHRMWLLCCKAEPVAQQPALSSPTGPVVAVPATTTLPPTPPPTDHPLNPQWFQTTHRDYLEQVALNDQLNTTGHAAHSHTTGWVMCSKQGGKELCPYDAYCPNGQGGDPFDGGTPQLHNSDSLHQNQWAPYMPQDYDDDYHKNSWVQVGMVSSGDGGTDGNDFLKCWTYDEYYSGTGEDIESKWSEDHRVWILCCDKTD